MTFTTSAPELHFASNICPDVSLDASFHEMEATTLDPDDWTELKALGHRMIDDMFGHLQTLRNQPVWQEMPQALRNELRRPLPKSAMSVDAVYHQFQHLIQPYMYGNLHPRFMGWATSGGNPIGMLADFLASALNSNLFGANQAPIEVERQVIAWALEIIGLPENASGTLVTGASTATLVSILVARTAALGTSVCHTGINASPLVAYASDAIHECVPRAMSISGLGRDALRLIPCDSQGRMQHNALEAAIARDLHNGLRPFLVVGAAGTTCTGAIDNLDQLADCAKRHGLWLHIDGANGAIGMLAPKIQPLLKGIERADSVAFDFHKWAQIPYDVGCAVIRDAAIHRATFVADTPYLKRFPRGIATGQDWPCDLGPETSRGFRALKVWMTFATYGADRIGAVFQHTCDLATALASRIAREHELELLATVTLNIVCFRFTAATGNLDNLNNEIVADLQESGIAAPSTTRVRNVLAIRVAVINHRTTYADLEAMLNAELQIGRSRAAD